MSTHRSSNKIVEFNGLRYIQEIVEKNNCIYQEVDFKNDQGNDCYIELIEGNVATSFCVFAQIKSGDYYKDTKGYKIPSDKAHLQYWNNHLLPVVGFVYDDKLQKAFWINITEYLKTNPQILHQKNHNIRVDANNEFTTEKFSCFKEYFIDYITEYKNYENFGRSLNQFSKVDSSNLCYEGLKSLFSNHRNKKAAWFYIISNFRNISEPGIHRNILGMLSNYANNPNIFWHAKNMSYYPSKEMQDYLSQVLTKCFREEEVLIALRLMGKMVSKGDFSFLVFLVLGFIEDIQDILLKISYSNSIETDERNFAFWLHVHFAQHKSVAQTIKNIDKYLQYYPDSDDSCVLVGMREIIESKGFIMTG